MVQVSLDDEFMPDEFYATWLGFLTAQQVDRKEWPFVKWLIEVYYKSRIDQGHGTERSITKAFMQLRWPVCCRRERNRDERVQHLLKAGVEQGTINSIDIGTLNASNIFDQIEHSPVNQ
ncbi:MAG: hypothetical protein IPF54_26810 [Draconibacterium sp.]|nr:hypothetical protein [Draconibacterium sp.]